MKNQKSFLLKAEVYAEIPSWISSRYAFIANEDKAG